MRPKLAGYIFIILGLPLFLTISIHEQFLRSPAQLETIQPTKYFYQINEIMADGSAGQSFSGVSTSTSPSQIALDLKIAPLDQDRYTVFPPTKALRNKIITLYRAPLYTVRDGKRSIEYRSWATTVSDLLSDKNVELGVDDKISPALDATLSTRTEITINRVAKTTVIVPESINFKTVKKLNDKWEKDVKKTIQGGAKGTLNIFYLVTREDGVEISRKYIKSEVAKAPTDEIIEVGTKVLVYASGRATWYKWPAMESKGEKYYAAHKTLAKGTVVWVVNTANGKGVRVTILDRVGQNAETDLSPTAFATISTLGTGSINVRIEKYYPE